MNSIVNLYSNKQGEIRKFLTKFFVHKVTLANELKWEKEYSNPIEIAEIVGTFIDNNDNFEISMWISIDSNTFINVTEDNADPIIRYLYERFPY